MAQTELKCPCCTTGFRAHILASTNLVGRCTDFRPLTGGIPFIFHTVQSCPECGFTWDSDSFEKVKLSEKLKKKVREKLTPRLGKDEFTPQRKHALHAQVYELMGYSPLHIAEAYLVAAWCCAYNNSGKEEMLYRKEAIKYFQAAMENDLVPEEERANVVYLIGELYQRIGDIANAHRWFEMVDDAIVEPTKQQWLLNLVEQQKNNPREELSPDIFENKKLKALCRMARDFFKNSQKLREYVRAGGKWLNYTALIDGKKQIILFLQISNDKFLIGFERKTLEDYIDWQDFMDTLGSIDKENIIVKDKKERLIVAVLDDTPMEKLELLLKTIESLLIDKL